MLKTCFFKLVSSSLLRVKDSITLNPGQNAREKINQMHIINWYLTFSNV